MTPALREANESDLRFVRSSWHASFWSTRARKDIEPKTYDDGQRARIDRLIPRSRVIVAFFPEVPDEVLGWSCIEGSALHYVYVKGTYRGRGIGRGLVEGQAIWYTHPVGKVSQPFVKSLQLKFNPYPLEKS